jgi:hypothetical protein
VAGHYANDDLENAAHVGPCGRGIRGGVFYAGYANELLKDLISPWDRVSLLCGFLLGAGAVSRWIMALDLRRNLKRIKRARAARGDIR